MFGPAAWTFSTRTSEASALPASAPEMPPPAAEISEMPKAPAKARLSVPRAPWCHVCGCCVMLLQYDASAQRLILKYDIIWPSNTHTIPYSKILKSHTADRFVHTIHHNLLFCRHTCVDIHGQCQGHLILGRWRRHGRQLGKSRKSSLGWFACMASCYEFWWDFTFRIALLRYSKQFGQHALRWWDPEPWDRAWSCRQVTILLRASEGLVLIYVLMMLDV